MTIKFCVALAVLVILPTIASAQGNPGPYGGLFGRAPATKDTVTSAVDVRSSIGGNYDTALLPPETVPDLATQSGAGVGATAGLSFRHASPGLNASLDGTAGRTSYITEPSYSANYFAAGAVISSALTARVRGDAALSYTHSPFFQFYQNLGGSGFVDTNAAAVAMPPFAPYAAEMLENEAVQAAVGVETKLTDRSDFTVSAHRSHTSFSRSNADLVSTGVNGRWNWELWKGFGVHAGYGQDRWNQAGEQSREFVHEIIDVGVDFNRALSLSRKTTLSFRTSSSIFKSSSENESHVRINGGVEFAKFFRRTWQIVAEARRETTFVPGFFEPLYADSVGLSLSGMFTKRVDWHVVASAGRAEGAFSETSGFNTASAWSRLNIALSKHLGLFGQYGAYRYQLPPNSNSLGLSERLARQTVSIGLNAYIPVYNKTRVAK